MNSHRLAELIPSMTDAQYAVLRDDIEANGLREPITLFEKQILDGRHRYRACRELGIDPDCVHYEGHEPAAFVISENVARRDLNPSQRAVVAVELLPDLEREARKRMARPGDPRRGANASSAPRTQASDPGHRAREDAGAKVGVSGATVDRARRVKEEAPEKYEEIKKGTKAVRAADNERRKEKKKPPAKKKIPFEVRTERQRQMAEKTRDSVHGVVGTCRGSIRALADMPIERAVAAAATEEIDGWDKELRTITSQINQFRKRLKEASS